MPGEAINNISLMPSPLPSAAEIIASLRLEPLPIEGGFFRRTYTSTACLPGGRAVGTAIYFLITPEGFSALHRLETDEVWHFYMGDPVEHLMLGDDRARAHGGEGEGAGASDNANGCNAAGDGMRASATVAGGTRTVLGTDLAHGQRPQLTVPGGVWQGARIVPGGAWALVGCTMSPGWDEREFTLGERAGLVARFPEWAGDIRALTR